MVKYIIITKGISQALEADITTVPEFAIPVIGSCLVVFGRSGKILCSAGGQVQINRMAR